MKRLLVTTLLVLLAVSARADEDRTWTVESVKFEGNEAFDNDRLKKLMVTRPGGFLRSHEFRPGVFREDVANLVRFYQQNGYLSAAVVDTQVVRDTSKYNVRIALTFEEGPVTTLAGISILGNEEFPDSILRAVIELEPGEAFRQSAMQRGIMRIASMYADSGYLEAKVQPEVKLNESEHRALVDLTVIEGNKAKVAGVEIAGLEKTQPYVVRRELTFEEGETLNYSALMDSQRRLYLTGLFRSVYIKPKNPEGGDPGARVVLVEVEEKLNSRFSVSVGYGSLEKIKGSTELTVDNLAGTARKAGIRVHANFIERGVQGSFTEPRTFGSRFRTDLNLFFRFNDEPSYDVSRYGGTATVGRRIGRHGNASLQYRLENAELQNVDTEELPEDFKSRIRSLTGTYAYDTRNNFFSPTKGIFMEGSYEMAGAFLSGTDAFTRIVLRLRWFHQIRRNSIFATALVSGWMDIFGDTREVPLNERFFTGGPNSVRAFDYQTVGPLDADGEPVGGKFKIVWNAELRQGIWRWLGAAVFVDVGNVWWSAADVRPDDLRYAVGGGARVNTPIGIVRVDYGFNVDPKPDEDGGKLSLSMGHTF